jgi:hypothetical protein
MTAIQIPLVGVHRRFWKLCVTFLILGSVNTNHEVLSFITTPVTWMTTRIGASVRTSHEKLGKGLVGLSSFDFPSLFAAPNSDQWDNEETLLMMSLSPLTGVSCEDSLAQISQYTRGFPFAVLLPTQPLQALPTDDGGMEIKFMQRTPDMKIRTDGGVRIFVRAQDQDDRIEVFIKRSTEGQSTPKEHVEKLIVKSFLKGMTMGSEHNNNAVDISPIKVPQTRVVSPTKDMVQIQSVFHKWIFVNDAYERKLNNSTSTI